MTYFNNVQEINTETQFVVLMYSRTCEIFFRSLSLFQPFATLVYILKHNKSNRYVLKKIFFFVKKFKKCGIKIYFWKPQ